MAATDTIGAELTVTSTRTLYWTATTDVEITGTPQIAILGVQARPSASTTWANAAWEGAETVAAGKHTRRLSALVAGPNGPTTGSPIVVPAAGEYSTWVRLTTSTERIEVQGQLLAVR